VGWLETVPGRPMVQLGVADCGWHPWHPWPVEE
jgi:hypothetical protein